MKTKVVIVDSGINLAHPKLNNIIIIDGINILKNNAEIIDFAGHGTAIANIMFSINADIEFYIVKIYEHDLIADETILLQALKYICKNFEFDILHLSLGTGYYNPELYDICKTIVDNGSLIVSAFDNCGCVSYPAAFDFVIGVKAKNDCKRVTDFYLPNDEIVSVYAKGGIHRVAWTEPLYAIQQGNSMSAAYVTGYLSKLYKKGVTKNEAMALLKTISTYEPNDKVSTAIANIEPTMSVDSIKHVALFPFNKEMSSLINYSNLLSFNISDVYTSKYLGNIGKEINNIYNDFTIITKSIDQIDFAKIDTLIIGHLTDLESVSNIDYKKTLLENCLKNHINVYSFDAFGLDNYVQLFKANDLHLFSPTNLSVNKKKRKGKLYKISSPVLAVLGTSSKQGKFTLQLQLRSILLEQGYTIAQLSSEPTGPLFGMDECFTFGFNSDNHLSEVEFINAVNGLMHHLDMKQPDLIIVGSQSGTIPEANNHLGQITIKQIEFLIGSLPDAVVLCVNPSDELTYIKRTIASIENIINTKVVALAIYPFFFENGWKSITNVASRLTYKQIEALKKKYAELLGIESFVIGEDMDIKLLIDCITNYFS